MNPGDVSVRHAFTGDRIRLHSFKHRGYWYRAGSREKLTMSLFSRLIQPGDTVVEAGGHVGFISNYFAHLVGPGGVVLVFEPGPNNLPYMTANTRTLDQVQVIDKAIGEANGSLSFFIEDLTGQNNSLIKDYQALEQNSKSAHVKAEYHEIIVDVVRLDDYLTENAILPDWIKIDIEGAEWEALQGALATLDAAPALMVEITRKAESVTRLLASKGYVLFTPDLAKLEDGHTTPGNVFGLHRDKHSNWIRGLGISSG